MSEEPNNIPEGMSDLVHREPAPATRPLNDDEILALAAAATLPEEPPPPLAPCPCGAIPGTLLLELPQGGKYGRVLGDCCGTWGIEFANHYAKDPQRTAEKAKQAWDEAPRQ